MRKLLKRGADHSQEAEARWLEKRRKPEKSGKDREEVLKGGPNKMTRGDLKGRKVDLKGSEEEVSDRKKGKAETLKNRRLKQLKTLPQKVEGTEALGG